MDELEIEFEKAEAAQRARRQAAKDLEQEIMLEAETTQHPAARNWFVDVGASAINGAAKAVTSTIDGVAAVVNKIPEHFGDAGIHIDSDGVSFYTQTPEEFKEYQETHPNILTAPTRAISDAVGEAETKTGALVGGVTQFVTGLMGTKKFFKAAELLQGTGKAVVAARNIAESAIASGLAFDGHDGNMANLVESSKALGGPNLHNAVTAALATSADDSELAGRLKNMAADAGVGVLGDVLIGGVRAVRAGKLARQTVADEIAAEVAGNTVKIDTAREIKFADDVTPASKEIRSPKTGDVVEISQSAPAVDLKLSIPPFNGRSPLAVEIPEQTLARLGEDIETPQAVAEKAHAVADEMRAAVEESKPGTPLKDMSPVESYETLRESLGITEEKLAQIRADVEAGKIGKEDVADLLHFNPSKFDWSKANDAESQVALMNTFTRVFSDALGKAGTGRVSMESIYAEANKIGANVDQAVGLWKRLQGVEAGVRAQQFTVAASGAHLDRLAKKVASGNYAPQELLDFVVHERRHALLQVTAQGSRSMIGRALRTMREGVQVNEAALKLSNGRRMRAERKARDVAAKAEAQAKARQLQPEKIAKARQARDAAKVAATRQQDATAHVEQTEAQLAEIARKFFDKAHKERLMGEQREAVRVAKEAMKQAEREAKAADELARKAEAEAAKYAESQDARFGVEPGKADVILSGDTKLQMSEVADALANLGMKSDEVVSLAQEIAKRGAAAKRSPAQVGFWMKGQERLTFLYVNNILSGLPTMAVNVSSGFLKMIESTFEHYGSAALATARGDKYAILAANKAAVATWTSWRAAWKIAGEAWKEGLPQTDVLARAEVAARGGAGESAVAKAISLPSRSILTIDEFFKHIFYQQELNARAVEVAASAAQLQHSPVLQKRMFDSVLKETMESPPDDLVLDAIEAARYQTFQNNLSSKLANDLVRMTNNTPLLKLAVPFIKTPVNILKQGVIERSPLSLLRKDVLDSIRSGTREGNTAALRIALGTALIGTVWNWADEGNITGSRAGYGRNRNTGDIETIPPYSIRIGGKWYQYNRLDPWGTPLGLVADLRAAYNARNERNSNALESDDEGLSEGYGNVLAILNKNLLDKTFFKGISDITSAVSNGRSDGGMISSYLQTLGSNLVPYSSFVRNIAKAHDEYAREAFTFSDKLLAQTPGLSERLPAQRDILGRPIPNAERLGPSWLSPFLVGKDDPDPVARELAALNMNYSKPDRDIAGVKLTAEQYSRLQEVRGEFLRERLKEWMDSGEWAGMTKYQKIEHVRRFLSAGGQRADITVMQEWPELGDHVRGLKAEVRALKFGTLE